MRDNLLEREWLVYTRYHMLDGSVHKHVQLFGVQLMVPEVQFNDVHYFSGFRCSLYRWATIVNRVPKNMAEDIGRHHTIPLLQAVVGNRQSYEEEEDRTQVEYDGHHYIVIRINRWEAYSRFKRYFSIRGSRGIAYHVLSPTDTDLAEFPFAPKKWEGVSPSMYQVIEQARFLKGMEEEFKRDMDEMFGKKGDDNART